MIRFYLNPHNLRYIVSSSISIVDKKHEHAVLNYAKFDIYNDRIELIATDSEVSVKHIIKGNFQGERSFCINLKSINEILRYIPEETVYFEMAENDNSLKIKCNDIFYSLLISNPENFPKIKLYEEGEYIEIKGEILVDIFNKISHSISNDETRVYLNGIFIEEKNSKLVAVATDGYRLSKCELDFKNNKAFTNGIIIPRKGMLEIKKLCEYYKGNIKLSIKDSFLYLNLDNRSFISVRLISREYPKYDTIIPNKNNYILEAEKEFLLNAIRRMKIMANERSSGIKLLISKKNITITANEPSLGEAKETIPVNYNGDDLVIGFNAKYLIDALSVYNNDEKIQMELNNEISPVVIKSKNQKNYMNLIMPLKI